LTQFLGLEPLHQGRSKHLYRFGHQTYTLSSYEPVAIIIMRVLVATAAMQLGSAIQEQVLREHFLGLGDTATILKPSREKPPGTTHDPLAHCEDALEGSICFEAIMYLKDTGFRMHPDWYPEYSAESLFQDVQAMLNAAGKSDCPIPCASTTDQKKDMATREEKPEEMDADLEMMEEKGNGALAKMGQTFKVMKKIESQPAVQDETDAEIEAEMMQAMADAKAQLKAPTTANVKTTEKREDGVHAKMAQMSKDMKKIEGKTAAQDETAAEIEAEMLQAFADVKLAPRA